MPSFVRDGYSIHYETHGSGFPVLFLHGICVSFAGNFGAWGWIDKLCSHGLQVIGMDFRGHGGSDKPHDSLAYGTEALSGDAIALLDHLNISEASLVGYSLGSAIALNLLIEAPQRYRRSVLIATGDGLIGLPPYTLAEVSGRLLQALARTEYPADLPSHLSAYWNFATKIGGDRLASAAAGRADYPPCPPPDLAKVTVPVLVISGESDPVLGRGPLLAQALPHGRYLEIAGADHFQLATNEQAQIETASFLSFQG